MAKKSKIQNPIQEPKRFYSAQPWQCRNHEDHSEIVAYVEASGAWEVIATIKITSGISADAMAQFICGLVNDYQKNKDLLRQAMEALEAVFEEGLNYSTEQAADQVVAQIKERVS